MQRLQGVTSTQAMSRRVRNTPGALLHVLECERLVRGHRITDSRLHFAPPTVISPAEPDQLSSRVIPCQTHRLHHSFGARHVKRNFIVPGNFPQTLNVLSRHRMQRTEEGAQFLYALAPRSMHSL